MAVMKGAIQNLLFFNEKELASHFHQKGVMQN